MAILTVSTPATYAKLAVITATHVFNDGALVARAALLPAIRNEFALGNTEVGLISSVSTIAAAGFQMPASFVADHTGRKRTVLVVGLLLLALTFVAYGWSPSYLALLGVSFLFGFAGSGYHPTSMAIVAEQFDARRKAFHLAVHNLGANLGSAVLPWAVGGLAVLVGWRLGVQYMAIPIVLVAVLTWFSFSDRRGGAAKNVGGSLSSIKNNVLLNRRLLLLSIVSLLNAGAYNGLMPFLPLYLADTFKWDTGTVGFALGVMHFTGIFSQPVVGHLADRYGRGWLMIITLFLTGMFTLAVPLTSEPTLVFVVLALLGLPLFCFRPLLFATAMDTVGPEATSSSVGFIFTMNMAFGTVAPLLGALVADRLGLGGSVFFFGAVFLSACLPALVVLRPRSRMPSSAS